MVRVCMVALTDYTTDTRIRREAESLVDRGDTVDVICLREAGKEKVRTFHGVRLFQVAKGRYRGSTPVMYLLKYLQFFFAATLWLTFLHLKKPYHVIRIHTMPDFVVFVAIIPKLLGAKVILDVHDLMPELYQTKFGLTQSHWLLRFIIWMERRSIGFAHRAIAVRRPHLDTMVSRGNPAEKFITLLNVPDPGVLSGRAEADPVRDGSFKLIYHGTVAKRHGLRVALQALSSVRKEIKPFNFQIVGVGEDIPHLIELAGELDLTDCVSINAGWAPLEELVPVILGADVGVIPILNDEFTKYMLPVKLLEYVALRIPVICSRAETIEACFDDSMVEYVESDNADELAEKILDLYRNPGKRKMLAANADRFNRDYS